MAATKKPKKTPEAVRQAVLADPNTKAIAEKLGATVEQYVEQVVHFAMNPGAEPSLYVVEDEDLRALGMQPPDADAMGQYLVEAVSVQKAAGATGFEGAKAKKVSLASEKDLPAVDAKDADPKLKAELDQAMRGKRGGKR